MTSQKDSLTMKLLLSNTKRLSRNKEIKVLSHVMRNAEKLAEHVKNVDMCADEIIHLDVTRIACMLIRPPGFYIQISNS